MSKKENRKDIFTREDFLLEYKEALTVYEETIRECTEAIEENIEEEINYSRRGHCYLELGQYKEALIDFIILKKKNTFLKEETVISN